MIPFILSLITTTILTYFLRGHLVAKSIMDIPNERSMHAAPVPRGGGLAIMAVVLTGLFVFMPDPFLLSALFLLMGVSWLDDKKGMRASVRLGVHLLAALLGSFALGEHATVLGDLPPLWLDRFLLVVGWAWVMNLYNFMDGIDGITSVQTICCALGLAALALLTGFTGTDSINTLLIISGACAGFLIFNWHPAKLFMGDVGSVALGFLVGFFALKLAISGHPLPALLIPLYYLADSGITITRRALRGEKIWKPHREHFYQRATAGKGSPIPVVLWIALTNIALIGCALLALSSPWLGSSLGAIVVSALLLTMSKASRQTKQ